MKKNGLLILVCLAMMSFASAQQPQTRAVQENQGDRMETPKGQNLPSAFTKKLTVNQNNETESKRSPYSYSRPTGVTSYTFTPATSRSAKGLTDMVYTFNEGDDHYTGQLGTPGTMTALPTAYPNEVQAGEFVDNILYIADYDSDNETNRFGTVNTTTGVFTQIGTTGPDATGIAWNPITNKAYVSIWGSAGALHEINLATGATTFVANTGANRTIAIDNDGVCYAITLGNPGVFGTIDLTTGAHTVIDSIRFHVNFVQNLSVDRTTNELYWSAREGTGTTTGSTGLYKMDKTTGARTLIGTFASGFNCESFSILTNYVANQDVPAAPTAFTATPDAGGALSCVLDWTNPTLTVGGDPLTTLTHIVITRDGTPIDSIDNPVVGATESYTDATTGGNHTYAVYAVNSDGDGLRVSVSAFVGTDAAVVSINQPVSGPNLTATETVQVVVKNNGAYPVTDLPVTLEVNGTVIVEDTITTSIASATQYTHTFTATADLSAVQTHAIKVYTGLASDVNLTNDTVTKSVENYGNVIIMGSVPSATSCDTRFMDDGAGNNYTTTDDQIITFLPATAGKMVNIKFTDLATAIDPYFGTYDAVFVLNGAFGMDDLENLEDEDILGAFAGDYATELPDSISAENRDGALTVYFMIGNFLGMTERGWDAEITCIEPLGIDAAVHALDVPASGPLTNAETITVTVINRGGDTLTNIPVVCEINGTALPTATIAGPLAPYATANQTFTADFSVLGTYDIVVYTDIAGDENHANDTAVATTSCLLPAAITWDFEQGMPTTFTLRVLDDGVANATAVFPNNEAWAVTTGDARLTPIGTQCAVSQSWFSSGSGPANRWMITPQIELGDEAMLQWDATCYEAAYPDGYIIKLSTTDMETASFTNTLITVPAENHGWTNRVVDLSTYAGEKVYIAFIQNSDDQNMLAMDNIKLLGDATQIVGLTKFDDAKISLYPNPARNSVNIEADSEINKVEIFNMSGQIISSVKESGVRTTINTSDLSPGLYFVRIYTEDGYTTKKVSIVK